MTSPFGRSKFVAVCCSLQRNAIKGYLERNVAAKNRLTVNLSDREYKELSALSDTHRVSLAWLGRQAIIEFLERYDKEALQLPLILSFETRKARG